MDYRRSMKGSSTRGPPSPTMTSILGNLACSGPGRTQQYVLPCTRGLAASSLARLSTSSVRSQTQSSGCEGRYRCVFFLLPNKPFSRIFWHKFDVLWFSYLYPLSVPDPCLQVLRALKHPNIIDLYEVFIEEGKLYMFMELCTGGELWHFLQEVKIMPNGEKYFKSKNRGMVLLTVRYRCNGNPFMCTCFLRVSKELSALLRCTGVRSYLRR